MKAILIILLLTPPAYQYGYGQVYNSAELKPYHSANPALHHRYEEKEEAEKLKKLEDDIGKITHPRSWLEWHAAYTSEFLSNIDGGIRTGEIYDGLIKATIQIDPGDLLGATDWKNGILYSSAYYPHGNSISYGYVGDLNGVSNIDAYDSLRLSEFWFQQTAGKASLRMGLIAADTEFFVCDSGSVLLNGCFGAIPVISQNFSAPVFPLAAPGLRVTLAPTGQLSLKAGVYSGDVGKQDQTNLHGTRLSFHSSAGLIWLGEIAFTSKIKFPGVYKLGGFYHSGDFSDLATGVLRRGNFGGYLVVDQSLLNTINGAGLNAFFRIGLTGRDDRSIVASYFEGGLACKGFFKKRAKDVLGIACSTTRMSGGALPATASMRLCWNLLIKWS